MNLIFARFKVQKAQKHGFHFLQAEKSQKTCGCCRKTDMRLLLDLHSLNVLETFMTEHFAHFVNCI